MVSPHFGILLAAFTILSVTTVLVAVQDEAEDEGLPSVELREFDVHEATLTELAQQLSRAAQVGVCVEDRRKGTFTFALENVTLRDVLNKIVATDPRYVWRWDAETKLVNVYPRAGAPLDWRIAELSFEDKTIDEVLFSGDLLGLKKHDIMFTHFGGNVSWLETPVSLNAEDITARQAMNLLCRQLGFKARWELWKREPRQARARRILMIRGYGVEPPQPAEDADENQDDNKPHE